MSNSTVKDEVARLTALVEGQGRVLEEQRRRLEELEHRGSGTADGNGNGNGNGESRRTRRDLLRLAGLAAAGAAGATALSTLPAAAGSGVGATFQLGQENNTDVTTTLNPTSTMPAGTAEGSLLDIDASVNGVGTAGSVIATSTFFRAIHGVSPNSSSAISGVGLWGSSLDGAGVIGSSKTGVDMWAFNTGRFLQSVQPAGQPTYQGGVYDPTIVPPATTPNGWTDLEFIRDVNGVPWVFLPPSVNGSNVAPSATVMGSWLPVALGGLGVAGVANHPDSQGVLFSAVSHSLLALKNSDGQTFQDMMVDPLYVPATPAQLVLTITPAFDCQAIITGNGDLYTDTAGFNQDIAIYVNPSDPANPPNNTQFIEAWKESGGFAGVNSPNAAFVETLFHMSRGTTYNVRLKWKANKSTVGTNATIRCGAGPWGYSASTPNPLATHQSPTRLTVLLLMAP